MNTQDVIKQFNMDLDRLIEKKHLDARESQDENKSIAVALVGDDPSRKSRVQSSLRKHLMDQFSQPRVSSHRPIRWQWAFATALVVLVAVVFTVPPLRAMAQDIIRVIGDVIVSNAPTDAEEYVATLQSGTPTPTPDPDIQPCEDCGEQVVGLFSLDEVSQMAGFSAYSPQYVPEGYWLAARDVFDRSAPLMVITDYRMELDPPLHDGLQMAGIISIEQIYDRNGDYSWDMNVGDIPIVNITVNGQTGVWLEQIPVIPFQDDSGQWEYERWNRLIWEDDGFTFIIQTNMPSDLLPLVELIRIAESLRP